MSNILRLSDFQATRREVCFDRKEIGQLLSIYSQRVIGGEWKDYALDHTPGRAVFAIFRDSRSEPAYSVIKLRGGGERRYELVRGRNTIMRGRSLSEVLAALHRKKLRLINS